MQQMDTQKGGRMRPGKTRDKGLGLEAARLLEVDRFLGTFPSNGEISERMEALPSVLQLEDQIKAIRNKKTISKGDFDQAMKLAQARVLVDVWQVFAPRFALLIQEGVQEKTQGPTARKGDNHA